MNWMEDNHFKAFTLTELSHKHKHQNQKSSKTAYSSGEE